MDGLWNRAGHYTFILCFFLSSVYPFFPSLFSAVTDWMSTKATHGANLGCRSETCCTRLAENTARKKSPKIRHLRTIAQLCRAMSLQPRHISTIGKMLLNSNISSTCSHNIVNFGPAAEICWQVWGTPAHYNGFQILAALLHGTLVVGVSQTLRRHLHSARRPSHLALPTF